MYHVYQIILIRLFSSSILCSGVTELRYGIDPSSSVTFESGGYTYHRIQYRQRMDDNHLSEFRWQYDYC